MYNLGFDGGWRWNPLFLVILILLQAADPPKALGYFLGDTKAVLSGCEDHWTLQDRVTMPMIFQMTVCVDIRVVVPGAWVAFSYSSAYAPRPELGLEGDDEALYGWLLRVRHRFPIRLSPIHWHRVCLRRDVQRNSFSLEVDGKLVAERTVIAKAIPPFRSLWLGCRPRDRPPGAALGTIELYLFRMWADVGNHGFCEDGTVIGWNAQYWGITSIKARQRDPYLLCDHGRLRRGARAKRSVTNATTVGFGRLFSPPPEVPSTTTTSSPIIAAPVTHMTTQTSVVTGTRTTTVAPNQNQEEQANQLLNQAQNASQLTSSEVEQLVGQLEKLLVGPTVSQSVGQMAINIVTDLMEGNSAALSASANRLIRVVDDLGLKLVVSGDRAILSSNSLVLAVRTVDGTNFPTTSVNIFNTDNVELRALRKSRSKRSDSALGSVFLPSSLTSGLSPEQQQQASRVQFTFYTQSTFFQDATLNNQTMVSPVLGSSVANLSISKLTENIQFTIRNINPIHENHSASCVFWDFTRNEGGGGWSSDGCFVVNTTAEETICSCNHLTSFAILLDLSREEIIDRQHAQILTFITYIGCGISAIFLAVTLLTYLLFDKLLRDIPAKILVQLCMSLLLLNLVFLLDGWLALYPAIGLCISTAFFLHYFLLTSFTWAGLEALHMYLSVVKVFTPYLSRYMLKFSLIGWGIPLMVVIIVISVDKDNYGLVTYGRNTDGTSDDFCWLRNDIAFYVGVVAYFLLIFSLCLIVFIMVMVQLSRIKKQNPQNQSPNRGVWTDLRSIAGLVILLGLTWGFALFAWGPLYLPFVYLFSIFNSLQGFFVFVFHCAVKENVRRQWRTYLCCGRLRLAENSEWSRTATQNNRNLSLVTATTLAPHFTSRSSSVTSDGTNSSGSVFADSGISDGSSSDVLLNEIHRRNLPPQAAQQ
ncbi:adhesion G-protein coupled receptor G2 [Tautogolabrus adspersus]